MFPSSYSSRRNSQRPMQDRASSSSTSSSRSRDQARSASASNSSSGQQSAANRSTSRDSRGDYSSSPGVVYRDGRWHAFGSGSFSTQEEAAWAFQLDRADRGLPPVGSRVSRPAHTDAVQRSRDFRARARAHARALQNTSRVSSGAGIDTDDHVASYMTSPTYEDAIQMPTPTASQNTSRVSSRAFNGIDTDDRSFYQDAASYMTSPTYTGAVRAGNSSSLEQLSLARSLIGRGGDSLWGQLDDEYRGQERGPNSRHNR